VSAKRFSDALFSHSPLTLPWCRVILGVLIAFNTNNACIMTNSRFEYNDELLEECALALGADAFNLAVPANHPKIPDPCWILFQQYSHHYGRNVDEKDRIRHFLQSVLMVYSHNGRRSLHSVRLNQFADLQSLESVLAPPATDDWLQLWDEDDWTTQTLVQEELTVMRLYDEESIRNAASLRNVVIHNERRQLHKHSPVKTTFVSPFVKDYPHFKIASDTDFAVATRTDTHRKKHDKQRDNTDSSFDTHLNWASSHNPDGVDIVHKVHDQVRLQLKSHYYSLPQFILTPFLSTGLLRIVLGVCRHGNFGSECVASSCLSSLSTSRTKQDYY